MRIYSDDQVAAIHDAALSVLENKGMKVLAAIGRQRFRDAGATVDESMQVVRIDRAVPHAKLHAPWLWEGFIKHFGCNSIEYVAIPDEGGTLALETCELHFIPAHYLHSSGNFHLYDRQARILMSG